MTRAMYSGIPSVRYAGITLQSRHGIASEFERMMTAVDHVVDREPWLLAGRWWLYCDSKQGDSYLASWPLGYRWRGGQAEAEALAEYLHAAFIDTMDGHNGLTVCGPFGEEYREPTWPEYGIGGAA